jgi:hypothetical protein
MLPPLFVAGLVGGIAKYYWQPQYNGGNIPALFEGDIFPVDAWNYLRGSYFPCDDMANLYQGTQTALETIASCGQSNQSVPVDIAIVGDSHATHLFFGLAEALPKKNVAYYAVSATPPIEGNSDMTRIIDYVARNSSINVVIISAAWAIYGISSLELAQTLRQFTEAGKKVFVTDDVPYFPIMAAQCKYGISPVIPISRCTQDIENFSKSYSLYYPQIEQAVNGVAGAQLINVGKYFCDLDRCDMTRDGILLYADGGHLNNQGSRYIARKLLTDNSIFANMLSSA